MFSYILCFLKQHPQILRLCWVGKFLPLGAGKVERKWGRGNEHEWDSPLHINAPLTSHSNPRKGVVAASRVVPSGVSGVSPRGVKSSWATSFLGTAAEFVSDQGSEQASVQSQVPLPAALLGPHTEHCSAQMGSSLILIDPKVHEEGEPRRMLLRPLLERRGQLR